MMYEKQVRLLLEVLLKVAQQKDFALHGGTAINLFVRDMPRLSVDIDLTYIPILDRISTLDNISAHFDTIQQNMQKLPMVTIRNQAQKGKLFITHQGVQIKIEVNTVSRGALRLPQIMPLCNNAQNYFNAFVEMPIIPFG